MVWWAQVQWFYSGEEVAKVLNNSSSDMYSRQKYERSASAHLDFVSPECFEDRDRLIYYDESAIDGMLIEDDDWFCRHQIFLKEPKRVMKYHQKKGLRVK
jgi:hypothetical protein